MTVTLLRGDALHLPIADHTVDLVEKPPAQVAGQASLFEVTG
jgi:hypothetical protein